MAYDSSKDQILKQRDVFPGGQKTGIEVSLCRYDNGPKKVSLQRFGIKKSGERYYLPNLKRLSLLEVAGIMAVWKEFLA